MEITIRFNIDNAAFVDDFHGEIRRTLANVAHHLSNNNKQFPIRDSNGNKIGVAEVKTRNRIQ